MISKHKNRITLSGISSQEHWLEPTLKALIYSKNLTGIKNAQLLSNKKFYHPEVECILIREIKDLIDYNYFVFKEYFKYIKTDFMLNIHDDGFVINPESWADDFLEYDYIGALWPHNFYEDKRCGNGGFSLRSKKLLYTLAKDCPFIEGINEDLLIGREYRDTILAKNNITFPPETLAAKFSIEWPVEEAPGQDPMLLNTVKSFGFHRTESPLINLINEINL
jgi:hypothetical protein